MMEETTLIVELLGITAEFSPDQTVVGSAVKVKGYVDGIRGRSQVTIRANGERKKHVFLHSLMVITALTSDSTK